MKKPAAVLANMLVAVAALSACGGRTESPARIDLPTAPSSPQPSAAGQIALRSIAPASGATLTVDDCPVSSTDRFKDQCSGPTQITVDVQYERDVSNAVVTASFYSGTRRCGLTYSESAPFAAGARASFELQGAIELSDEYVQLHCVPPAETTRLVIQLWDAGRPATPLLTQEFAHRYTFVDP
jgi:hypothetical protein